MMPQKRLPYQYSGEKSSRELTQYAGVFPFVDLMYKSRLLDSIAKHINVRTDLQGYTAPQMLLACLLLNILGFKSIEHVNYLEADEGLAKLLNYFEKHDLKIYSKFGDKKRWRKKHCREFPSTTTLFNYLKCFHDASTMTNTKAGAYIPPLSDGLRGLLRVLKDLVAFAQKRNPIDVATIDQDATLAPSGNQNARYCYKGYKAYQPMNSYWFEQGVLIHSEFCDGNVPAAFDVLRVLKESLEQLPDTVKTVYFRADGAGYQKEVIRFCDSGKSRFGVIPYAVSAEVSPGLKEAAHSVLEEHWHDLITLDKYGNPIDKQQQWAEIPYVPGWVSHKKSNPDTRFIAIREVLHGDKEKNGQKMANDDSPFPTCTMNSTHYKLFAVATNRYTMPGDKVIHWHRQRCGHSEDLHKEEKNDNACQRIPSKYFGVNAAWWLIMVIAYDLEKIIQSLLPENFQHYHLNKLRREIIALPGKIIHHSRRIIIKLNDNCRSICQTLIVLRQRIMTGGVDPPQVI